PGGLPAPRPPRRAPRGGGGARAPRPGRSPDRAAIARRRARAGRARAPVAAPAAARRREQARHQGGDDQATCRGEPAPVRGRAKAVGERFTELGGAADVRLAWCPTSAGGTSVARSTRPPLASTRYGARGA